QSLGAGARAVEDGVAPIEAERVLEGVEAGFLGLVAAVGQPPPGLEQYGGTQETVAVPPMARAPRRAGEAEDALVVSIELGPRLRRLQPLCLRLGRRAVEPRFDHFVLGGEVSRIRH